jgi:hypothetical protein
MREVYTHTADPWDISEVDMEFRLVYWGELPSAQSGGHSAVKHRIRQEFHKQLRELWTNHHLLSNQMAKSGGPEIMAGEFAHHGYRFIPLASERNTVVCALDILFLRRENPGHWIVDGGDFDNRIKTLLDAMEIPKRQSDLPPSPATADEDPFFCLMEDDKLVTSLRVTTDRLLLPHQWGQVKTDVFLVIDVRTRAVNPRAMYSEVHGW